MLAAWNTDFVQLKLCPTRHEALRQIPWSEDNDEGLGARAIKFSFGREFGVEGKSSKVGLHVHPDAETVWLNPPVNSEMLLLPVISQPAAKLARLDCEWARGRESGSRVWGGGGGGGEGDVVCTWAGL